MSEPAAQPVRLSDHARDDTSQCGENGIIETLFDVIGPTNKVCVEFGAHHLTHISNVAPLWMRQGWRAYLIEGDPELCRRMKADYRTMATAGEIAGDATIVERHVRPEGPDSLDAFLPALGVPFDLDLMSIDVDGIDFHIWKGMADYRPRVMVIEYNNTAPPHIELVGRKDGNNFGASARALYRLGREKEYALVACTGSNMVFVTESHAPRFDGANDLDALFDRSGLCYVMRTFEGGIVLSRKPTHGFNPFSFGSERSLDGGADVYFPDKSFRHLLELWTREMRVRARNAPLRRGVLLGVRALLIGLHAIFGHLFRDPARRSDTDSFS